MDTSKKCPFQIHDGEPCVILHGDYCYSAENVTNDPICRSCWRKPHETGVPKPKGFDEMMTHYLKAKNTLQ